MKTTTLRKLAITSLIAGGVLLPVVSYACYNQVTNKPKPQSVKVEAKKEAKATDPTATSAPVATEAPAAEVAKPTSPPKVAKTEPTPSKKSKSEQPKGESESSSVSAISLSGAGSSVSWVTSGTAGMGYKVVWSMNPGPTYPTRSGDKYHYLSSPGASADTISAFSGPGTYYVRVCEYLGGKCGTYSNQITVTLP